MKKYIVLFVMIAGFATASAQGFKAGFGAGYLTGLDGGGGSVDLIYELNEKWGISNTNTFAFAEIADNDRLKWFAIDLNARYNIGRGFYAIAGGEYLSSTFVDKTDVGGFSTGEEKSTTSEIGGNLGAGFVYNLIDNVNIFVETKYTFLELGDQVDDSGYLHARLGLLFDF